MLQIYNALSKELVQMAGIVYSHAVTFSCNVSHLTECHRFSLFFSEFLCVHGRAWEQGYSNRCNVGIAEWPSNNLCHFQQCPWEIGSVGIYMRRVKTAWLCLGLAVKIPQ